MTAVQAGNLFETISAAGGAADEEFAEILSRPGLKIERIVSHGNASPPGFWYDQAWNEWVIVLKGGAGLRFEDEPGERAIAARRLHLYPGWETPPRRVDRSGGTNGLARRPLRVSGSARTGLRNQLANLPSPCPSPRKLALASSHLGVAASASGCGWRGDA